MDEPMPFHPSPTKAIVQASQPEAWLDREAWFLSIPGGKYTFSIICHFCVFRSISGVWLGPCFGFDSGGGPYCLDSGGRHVKL